MLGSSSSTQFDVNPAQNVIIEYFDIPIVNTMISKKKKSVKHINLAKRTLLQQSSLFSPKAQKQHLIQQLKKGTLFNFYPRKDGTAPSKQSLVLYRDDGDWLSHIRLCGQEEDEPGSQENCISNKQLSKTVPNSKHFPAIQKRRNKIEGSVQCSNRCGKLICYEKKLQKTAAWNKQNPNNIDKNTTYFGNRLFKNKKEQPQSDFKKIPGLNFNDRSFEQSILIFGPDTSFSTNNAFQNLYLMNTAGTSKLQQKCLRKLLARPRKRKEVQGHFLPGFLLESILLQDGKRNRKNDQKFTD